MFTDFTKRNVAAVISLWDQKQKNNEICIVKNGVRRSYLTPQFDKTFIFLTLLALLSFK